MLGKKMRMGAPRRYPGHTPRTRFACARPFRFAKGAVHPNPLPLRERGFG